MEAVFTACIRPDCPDKHPRYCSLDCAREMEGKGSSVDKLEGDLTAANLDLATSCTLLRRAMDVITLSEMDLGQALCDREFIKTVAAFLGRVRT